MMTFGEKIKEAREKRGISQEIAAKEIQQMVGRAGRNIRLSPSYLSMIENGNRTNITTNLKEALVKYYEIEPKYLFNSSQLTIGEDASPKYLQGNKSLFDKWTELFSYYEKLNESSRQQLEKFLIFMAEQDENIKIKEIKNK